MYHVPACIYRRLQSVIELYRARDKPEFIDREKIQLERINSLANS